MSCPEADTKAILYLFGEAGDDFENHLRQCDHCKRVVDQHNETLEILEESTVGQHLNAHGKATKDNLLDVTISANNHKMYRGVTWLTLPAVAVAALLLVVSPVSVSENDSGDTPNYQSPTVSTMVLTMGNSIDDEFASLELELAMIDLEGMK